MSKSACYSCDEENACTEYECKPDDPTPAIFLENVTMDDHRQAIIRQLLQFLKQPTAQQLHERAVGDAQRRAVSRLPHLHTIELQSLPPQAFAGNFSAFLGSCNRVDEPVGVFVRMTPSDENVARWLLQLKNAFAEGDQVVVALPDHCQGLRVNLEPADDESITLATRRMLRDIGVEFARQDFRRHTTLSTVVIRPWVHPYLWATEFNQVPLVPEAHESRLGRAPTRQPDGRRPSRSPPRS